MPPTEDKTAIRTDIIEVYIDDTKAPYMASVELDGPKYVGTNIVPASTAESLGKLINARAGSGVLNVYQTSENEWRQFAETDPAAGANQHRALAQGGFVPMHKIRFHDPTAPNNNGDLTYFAVTFGEVKASIDGQGAKILQVPWEAHRHTDGTFWEIKAPS